MVGITGQWVPVTAGIKGADSDIPQTIWADKNGFRFSESKTVCVHFCRRHTTLWPWSNSERKMYPVVEETNFLGVIFDRKSTFIPHMKYLQDKCMKAMKRLKI